MRFGRLVAVERTEQMVHATYLWLCRCDCGNTVLKSTNALNSGKTRSCGCLKREVQAAGPASLDLMGQRFGRLLVIERLGVNKKSLRIWRVRCDCGSETQYNTDTLNQGKARSCGCINKENQRARQERVKQEKYNLLGMRVNWLKVIGEHPERQKNTGNRLWLCKCLCGNTKLLSTSKLIGSKPQKSCGCAKHSTGRRAVLAAVIRKCGWVRHLKPARLALGTAIHVKPQRNEGRH